MRVSAGWISIFCGVLLGGAGGVLLGVWSWYDADALAYFATNGPGLVLARPLFFVALFGATLGWLLSSCSDSILGTAGLASRIAVGTGIAFSIAVSVAVGYFLEKRLLDFGSLLILSVFLSGAVIGVGIRRRKEVG